MLVCLLKTKQNKKMLLFCLMFTDFFGSFVQRFTLYFVQLVLSFHMASSSFFCAFFRSFFFFFPSLLCFFLLSIFILVLFYSLLCIFLIFSLSCVLSVFLLFLSRFQFEHPVSQGQCSHVDRRKREAMSNTLDRKLARKRLKRHLRKPRAAGGQPNSNIILPDKTKPPTNKLNSSEVIRLTVVITDKKKEGQKSQGNKIKEGTNKQTNAHTHARIHARTRTHAHTHAYTRVRTHARTHARTHTHTHTHTHTKKNNNNN